METQSSLVSARPFNHIKHNVGVKYVNLYLRGPDGPTLCWIGISYLNCLHLAAENCIFLQHKTLTQILSILHMEQLSSINFVSNLDQTHLQLLNEPPTL